ncbi:MAG: hypothetical protein CM1200mP16_00860 [Nitrospina sp.]|nr:MAG: hypothetical protein CM1200mP16_00860 [Nitrospina sp.]
MGRALHTSTGIRYDRLLQRIRASGNDYFQWPVHQPDVVKDILKSGLDSVTFSIDSINGNETVVEGHTSSKVYENIEAVILGRKGETPKVRLQATIHSGCENDLYDVIRYGGRIGCDVVNVGRLDRQFRPNFEKT